MRDSPIPQYLSSIKYASWLNSILVAQRIPSIRFLEFDDFHDLTKMFENNEESLLKSHSKGVAWSVFIHVIIVSA